ELELAPAGKLVRVRALESLKQPAPEVVGVARVAVNLRGADKTELVRGMALTSPAQWTVTELIDVRLHGALAAAELPGELTLHIGSAAVPARIRPLGGRTARLTLGSPLPLHIGDRALLRDPGRHLIPAGLTVLDVRPPPLRRRGAAAARAEQLAGWPALPDAAVL